MPGEVSVYCCYEGVRTEQSPSPISSPLEGEDEGEGKGDQIM